MKTSPIRLFSLLFLIGCMVLSTTANAQHKVYNISEYGAKSGTESLQTKYIQAAIDAANKKGGGKVIVISQARCFRTHHFGMGVDRRVPQGLDRSRGGH